MPHTVPNEILVPEIGRLLKEGKEVRFTPTGVSMRPFIEGGRDSVILRRLDRTHRAAEMSCSAVLPRSQEHRLLFCTVCGK